MNFYVILMFCYSFAAKLSIQDKNRVALAVAKIYFFLLSKLLFFNHSFASSLLRINEPSFNK